MDLERGIVGDVQLAGVLRKMKEGKNWQQRHCSLLTGAGGVRFVYRKKETDTKPLGILSLQGAQVVKGFKAVAFTITAVPTDVKGSAFFLECENEVDRDKWVATLQELISNAASGQAAPAHPTGEPMHSTLQAIYERVVARDPQQPEFHQACFEVLETLGPVLDAHPSEKDAKLAQKLGQLQPFIAVFPQECVGQLASFGPS